MGRVGCSLVCLLACCLMPAGMQACLFACLLFDAGRHASLFACLFASLMPAGMRACLLACLLVVLFVFVCLFVFGVGGGGWVGCANALQQLYSPYGKRILP